MSPESRKPPSITDPPPPQVREDLAILRAALDETIPPRIVDRNLLIATWNLRAFASVTKKWQAGEDDSPKRDYQSVLAIAEIISRFDVAALQEVKGNLRALRYLLKVLGPQWGLLLTDVSRGHKGNAERMAFVFDLRRVTPSGLAAELVVPEEWRERIGPDALREQFARTPYAVSFRAKGRTFILVTLHVRYGSTQAERLPEIRAIAEWMGDWARQINAWHHNLIVLGDFNIDRRGDALYDAFVSTGLTVPPGLHNVPRTLFSDPKHPDLSQFYDQIAWFTGKGNTPALSLPYLTAGHFDFSRTALQSQALSRQALSWRISDHYPLWVAFSLR